MKKIVLHLTLLAVLLANAVNIAWAATPGTYLGAEIGYGNIYPSPTDSRVTSETGGVGGTSGRFFAGYQFTPAVALEFGYTRFSNRSVNYTDNNVAASNVYTGIATVAPYALDLVVKAQVALRNSFSLIGKLGFAGINENAGTVLLISPFDGTAETDYINKTSILPTYTLGLDYEINKNISTDLTWMRIQNMGGSNIKSTDFIALGLNYYLG